LINQQIVSRTFKSTGDIANNMGALQAQDFPMSMWALGTRLNNATIADITAAFNRGEILRTHLLRPTLHLVSPENIRWLLKLTAPRIKSGLRTRHNELELSDKVLKKCYKIFRESLKDANHLTREELFNVLAGKGIIMDSHRVYHIIVSAELESLICSGVVKGGKQTYALMDERVPEAANLSKEEALGRLAGLYFSSRGPATVMDFKWWSGLSLTEAKNGLELAKSRLIGEHFGSEVYWLPDNMSGVSSTADSVFLLPAFDEFLISYTDRSASLPAEHFKRAVSFNGIFHPVIVRNGKVIGLWKRTIKKGSVTIETEFFETVTKTVKNQIKIQAGMFGRFLGKESEVKQ
jgi:hypothetical protein